MCIRSVTDIQARPSVDDVKNIVKSKFDFEASKRFGLQNKLDGAISCCFRF